MTWQLFKHSGTGQLKWRVKIAGCPIEFVSHPDMVRGRDGFEFSAVAYDAPSMIMEPITWNAGAVAPVITTGHQGPEGFLDAIQMSDEDAAGALPANAALTSYSPISAGEEFWFYLPIKAEPDSQSFPMFRMEWQGVSALIPISIHPGSGRLSLSSPYLLASRISRHPTNSEWWIFVAKFRAPPGATGVRFRCYPANGWVRNFPASTVAAVGATTFGKPRMVKASWFTVPERRLGLATDGFKFAESVELPTAKWKAEPFTVRIVDQGNHATRLFSTIPAISTYLRSDVTATASMVPVLSTEGFPDSGDLWLNTETIHYTSKSSNAFLDCTRHTLGSGKQAHYADPMSESARDVEVTSWPQCFEGRRVYIYAYGAGDDPTLDGGNGGEPVWRGVVSTEPRYNGLEWSFGVDSLARFLDQDLASDLGEVEIRGIYYPETAPLSFYVIEYTGPGGGIGATARGWFKFAIAGYWETLDDFLAAVNAQLATRSGSPDDGAPFLQTIEAVRKGEGWALEYVTDAATPLLMDATVRSATDKHKASGQVLRSSDGATISGVPVAAETAYYIPIEGGGFPRATLGRFHASDDPSVDWTSFPTSKLVGIGSGAFPNDRIYLGGSVTLTDTIGAASFSWSTSGPESGHERAGTEDFTAPITARNTGSRWIKINRGVLTAESAFYAASGDSPEIKLARIHSTGSLATFLKDLTDDTPEQLNRGTVPDLRTDDIDLTELQALLATSQYSGPQFSARKYAFYDAQKLSEVIEQECMLLGVYPCLASDGRLSFRKLSLPILAGAYTLTSRQIIVGDQPYSLEKSAIGLYNTVVFKTGYDALEDEHSGATFTFRNVRSFGQTPVARTLEVAPISEETAPASVTDLDSIASAVTTIFGVPYWYLTVEVPFTLFDVTVGEVVKLNWKKVPNSQGRLGVTEALGLVVSRTWEPKSAKGMLTLYFTGGRFSGYVPSARLLLINSLGSNTFDVYLSPEYFAAGKFTGDHWEAGDKVRVYRWDNTGSAINATVLASYPNDHWLKIQTDGPWSPGSADWAIGSQDAGAVIEPGQKAYVYVADASGRIPFADGDAAPFVLGP